MRNLKNLEQNRIETLPESETQISKAAALLNCAEFIKLLEREALAKKLKENAHDDPYVRTFQPNVVIYLLASNSVNKSGHSSLLFLDNTGNGIFYNTADLRDIIGAIKGSDVGFVIDRKVLSKNDTKYLLYNGRFPLDDKFKEKKSLFKYDKFIAMPLESIKEGKIALNKADEIYQKPGRYNLYERNCNHFTQEVLSEVGKNFSPIIGSSEIVKESFSKLVESVKKLDFISAKKIFGDTYAEIYEMGIIPNGSYEKGVEFAKQRKYKFGALPIRDFNDLVNKPAKYFDPITDNLFYIKNSIDNYNHKNKIIQDVESIYNKKNPKFNILIQLHKELDEKNINGVYNIINKNSDLKIDRNGLKKLVDLYNFEAVNLPDIKCMVLSQFIKKSRMELQKNIKRPTNNIPSNKKVVSYTNTNF
jgi:hypothetical protein